MYNSMLGTVNVLYNSNSAIKGLHGRGSGCRLKAIIGRVGYDGRVGSHNLVKGESADGRSVIDG